MELRIVVPDQLVSLAKTILSRPWVSSIVALVVVFSAGGVVLAVSSTPTNEFQANTPISASAVNTNFAELYEAVHALEQRVEELEPGYCGITDPSTANLGGYAGAATRCRALDGCSDNSQICTGTDMVRILSAEGSHPWPAQTSMWVASGVAVGGETVEGGPRSRECEGFNSTSPFGVATVWRNNLPNPETCNVSHPIACCD